MTGRYLLDTNIIIGLFRGETSVKTQLEKSAEIFVPVIAIGELYYGAYHSSDFSRHANQVEDFALNSAILNCDSTTAKHYAETKQNLKLAGTPIPENDLWIAAIAKQFDLTLVSRDKHFGLVNDVNVVRW